MIRATRHEVEAASFPLPPLGLSALWAPVSDLGSSSSPPLLTSLRGLGSYLLTEGAHLPPSGGGATGLIHQFGTGWPFLANYDMMISLESDAEMRSEGRHLRP
ncbi:hypothetical protein N7468_010663 [Penicillium chermesinum]|uniref:Uncharacterized protein n=1 Tax=Penicillium chermesinum TaxID=63820 RepID=A0A9W9TA87_9EURO|nr:uncharacterized protein N7468_010663 [Penicillium chermesinum]KAJ5214984.1 hypothetical protein N7468_010663 [Penicillium chermesinum]